MAELKSAAAQPSPQEMAPAESNSEVTFLRVAVSFSCSRLVSTAVSRRAAHAFHLEKMTHALRPSKHHSGGRNLDSFNGRRQQFVCKFLLFGCWEITFSWTAHPLKYEWGWPHMQRREKSMRSCPFFLSPKYLFQGAAAFKVLKFTYSEKNNNSSSNFWKYSVPLASTFHRARTRN